MSRELAEKAGVDLAFAKSGAADDDLVRAQAGNFPGAGDGSNAAANANFLFVALAGVETEFAGECVVVAGTDGGVQVDEMQPGIGFEPF